MVYLGYETFRMIFSFTDFIHRGYSNVYDSVFSFLRNGIQRYFETFKIQAVENDLEAYYTRLGQVEVTLDQFIFAIKLGAIIGTCIAVIAVLFNILLILFDYKERILNARKGIFDFKKEKISIQASASLPGAIISNSIFIFFVIIIVLMIFFSIIATPLFWKVLWRLKWNLISILAGTLVNIIFKLIINRLCYNFEYVKRRSLLSIFDFILLQVAILAGIVSALTRFGILCIVLFISVLRIDVPAVPSWALNFIYLDSFNKAFYGSILMQHNHNNPIMITFYELMFLITRPVDSDKKMEGEERKRINR